MKTFVINLKRCQERRAYMHDLLANYPMLDVEFIDAVDGKYLSKEDKERFFDYNLAFSLYGKQLSDGEIGCTLSHQMCYKKMIEEDIEYALILEDDLLINNSNIHELLNNVGDCIKKDSPMVLLLSGDYWWITKQKFYSCYFIANVYDASCTQSYIINKKAAQMLLSDKPGFLADDWMLFSQKVVIKAIYPHLMDQNRGDFLTEVEAINIGIVRNNLSVNRNLQLYINSITKMILKKMGHFESKNFKWSKNE